MSSATNNQKSSKRQENKGGKKHFENIYKTNNNIGYFIEFYTL